MCRVPMDATFQGGSNDTIGGRVQLRRPRPTSSAVDITDLSRFAESCRQYSLFRWTFIGGVVDNGEQFIGGVVDTGKQFFGGVVDTGDNVFPRCRWYRSEITKNIKFITGINDTAEKLFSGVNDTADKFISGVVDTGDKKVLPILACLHLKIKNKQKFYL